MPASKHSKSTSLPLETPLHSAARLPPTAAAPILDQLLRAAADPMRTDQFGQTPLHLAAASCAQLRCNDVIEVAHATRASKCEPAARRTDHDGGGGGGSDVGGSSGGSRSGGDDDGGAAAAVQVLLDAGCAAAHRDASGTDALEFAQRQMECVPASVEDVLRLAMQTPSALGVPQVS